MTTRFDVLRLAAVAVTDRGADYGRPEDNARLIAALWSAYLGTTIEADWVAPMMALFKLARIRANPLHADSWVDLAGYAAFGGEVALRDDDA